MSGRLECRRIAVAGAGGGLGPHVVKALAAEGAWVAATDRSEDLLQSCSAHLGHGVTADLSTEEGARAWAAEVGDVDGLLHLIGGWRGGKNVEEMDFADLELLELLLFRTLVYTTRAFAPALKRAGENGRFATVSSSVVGKPTAGNAAYAATKAAAEAWTKTLAAELAETGGTANIVAVNAIVTPQMREENPDKAYKTFTDVGEIAQALVYLCSDDARKMNGQHLRLHAGV
jgi:NAD(P)-dependent dehydrogenase (short-subunit alcohol dehydrogenase family)